MRLFFYLVCLFYLTSCVNYAGIHGNAEPLTASNLAAPAPRPLSITTNKQNWWYAFHDKTLNAYIHMALNDSPTIKIAENRVRQACYIAEKTNASRFPTLDGNAYARREHFSETGLIPPPFNGGTFNIANVALNFNYEFDFWGKNQQRYAASVSQLLAAEANQAEARLVLSTSIAYYYFQLENNRAQIQLARAALQTQQKILAINNIRHQHGLDSAIPVTSNLSDVGTLNINLLYYKQAAALNRHQLVILMGHNPLTMQVNAGAVHYHHYQIQLPHYLPANLLAMRPDILAARDEATAAAHQINVAKARFFPNINLIGLFSYQSIFFNQLFEPDNQDRAIEGAIDLPIFDANRRRANFGAAIAAYDTTVNQYNQTILTALQEVADQETSLRSLQVQLASQRQVVQAAMARYHLVMKNYQHGIADFIQVLVLKENYLQTQMTAYNLETAHLHSTIAMIKALGGQPLIIRGSA